MQVIPGGRGRVDGARCLPREPLLRPRVANAEPALLREGPSGHKILVMSKRQPRTSSPRQRARDSRMIPAAEFKTHCLELMDQVRETRAEYVVTKHGRPVAKLVPYTSSTREPLFGALRGTVLAYDRPFDPIDGEWDV